MLTRMDYHLAQLSDTIWELDTTTVAISAFQPVLPGIYDGLYDLATEYINLIVDECPPRAGN